MKNKIHFISLSCLIICSLLCGCTASFNKTKNEKEIKQEYTPVEVQSVELGNIYDGIEYTGKVSPEKDSMILSSIPGEVETVKVKMGDKIKKGDLLFTIKNEELKKQEQLTKNALNKTVQKKNEFEENLKKEIPQDIPNVSNMPVDMSKMPNIENDINQNRVEFEKQIGQLESSHQQAKNALDKLKIKSPINGIVSYINIKEGGISSNTEPSMIVSDLTNMYLEINVTDNIINKLSTKDKVSIDIPSISINGIEGVIDSVSISPNMRNGLYPVKISFKNKDYSIKPGMIAKANIKLDEKKDVVVVKSDWIIDKDEEKFVYVVQDGKAIKRKITTGLDIGEKVEVVKGLKTGEQIIVKGQNFVEDDTKVKIIRGEK